MGIDENSISEGVSKARLAGRLQFFRKNGRTFIVDGCHNPSGFEPLKEALETFDPEDTTVVFGCLSDKDIDGCLSKIGGLAARAYAVKPPGPRAMDGDKILSSCKRCRGQRKRRSR